MENVRKNLEKLQEIIKKYPLKIPLTVVADFLGIGEDGLRAALMRGNAPFGFAYQKADGAYRVAVIPSTLFYLWYNNCSGQQVMLGDAYCRKGT